MFSLVELVMHTNTTRNTLRPPARPRAHERSLSLAGMASRGALLDDVARRMGLSIGGLPFKDRTVQFVKFRRFVLHVIAASDECLILRLFFSQFLRAYSSFTGAEALRWLLATRYSNTEAEALELGNDLVQNGTNCLL